MKKKLYLVDVSSMFFRAFFAIRHLSSPSGMPTNAIYGFLSMITKLLKEEKPNYLAFCYDRKEPSFREEIDPEYKAHRAEMPDDLVPQIPYIKKFVDALAIPSFEKESYEADDLIGTLSEFGVRNNLEVVIVSGDKDFAQLVKPGVILYDTMKDTRIDVSGVQEKWGVRPDQFIDYLAIIGDSSDNVKGVAGIGPKGAQKLLAEFETLDGIYANLDKIKSDSVRQKLIDGKDSAYLSKKLVTIVTDVALNAKLDELQLKQPDRETLHQLFTELNFKTFERSLLGNNESFDDTDALDEGKDAKSENSSDQNSNNFSEKSMDADGLAQFLKLHEQIWFVASERGYYLLKDEVLIHLQGNLNEIGQVLSEKKLKWSGFDLKSIWRALQIKNPQCQWDSMLAAYVVQASSVNSFEECYTKYTHRTPPALPSPSEEVSMHLQLQKVLWHELKRVHGEKIYQEFELPLVPVLHSMEQNGILLDVELLRDFSHDLNTDIRRLEKNIHEAAGEVFNIASPKQLAHILFDKLKMPVGKKTKTGYSTDNEVLENLKLDYPIVESILEYRELTKLKSTYVDALPTLVDPKTNRIHTHFNQALTTTGRLSSTNPNLQNIPIRTPRGAYIRKAFIAPQGWSLVSADYSQIELRVLAHITGDPGLCRAFADDLDIHALTAAEVFGVALKDVTPDMRRKAKAVNFGIAYGQGAFGLAENLSIPRGEAQDIIKRYFEKFGGVQDYMQITIEQAKKDHYVSTIFGRRRNMIELKSASPMIKKFGERAAINAPIQGSASDIVKLAMISIAQKLPYKMLLQVHDELLFEVKTEETHEAFNKIKNIMENVVELRVPLKVNGGAGKNWDEAH